MGYYHPGVPEILVKEFQNHFNLTYFIETGTYLGNTANWASSQFENVVTIEASKELFFAAKNNFKDIPNIQFTLGDSAFELSSIVTSLPKPAVFWLDAHWSGGITTGVDNQCPLLKELDAINKSELEHFILIDDARFFLSPPPFPHSPNQWPNIVSIIDRLRLQHDRYIVIIEDVIVAVPEYAKSVTAEYCQITSTMLEEDRITKIKRKERLARLNFPRRLLNKLNF